MRRRRRSTGIGANRMAEHASTRKRCPHKPCRRMVRLTNAGTFYVHKPYTRKFSNEMIPECPASGETIESFHVKHKREGAQRDVRETSD